MPSTRKTAGVSRSTTRLVDRGLDQLSWRVYRQFNDTSQVIDRQRLTVGFGPPSLLCGTARSTTSRLATGDRRRPSSGWAIG